MIPEHERSAALAWYHNNRDRALARQRDYHAANVKHVSKRKRQKRSDDPVLAAFTRVKARATMKGIPFDLTVEYMRKLYTGYCALTGIAFVDNNGRKDKSPLSASLDRKNPWKGYVKGNVHFIISFLNDRKGRARLETFMLDFSKHARDLRKAVPGVRVSKCVI